VTAAKQRKLAAQSPALSLSKRKPFDTVESEGSPVGARETILKRTTFELIHEV